MEECVFGVENGRDFFEKILRDSQKDFVVESRTVGLNHKGTKVLKVPYYESLCKNPRERKLFHGGLVFQFMASRGVVLAWNTFTRPVAASKGSAFLGEVAGFDGVGGDHFFVGFVPGHHAA